MARLPSSLVSDPGGTGTGAGGAYVSAGGGSATGVYRGASGVPTADLRCRRWRWRRVLARRGVGGDAGPPGGSGAAGLTSPYGGGGGTQSAAGTYYGTQAYAGIALGTAGSGMSGGQGCRHSASLCSYPGGSTPGFGSGGCGWTYVASIGNGGGGGAGWFGGGGGACGSWSFQSGGGGGSSYVNTSFVTSFSLGGAVGRSTGLGANGNPGSVTFQSCIAPPSASQSQTHRQTISTGASQSQSRTLTSTASFRRRNSISNFDANPIAISSVRL